MKLKYLYETAADIIKRVEASTGSRKWQFVANPQCCELCSDMNGVIVDSDTEPQWYAHMPNQIGRFNCKCLWKLVENSNG